MANKSCDNSINISYPSIGHCYRLCPFSEEFYVLWGIPTSSVSPGNEYNSGNSYKFPYGGRSSGSVEYPDEYTEYGNSVRSLHTTTSGNLIVKGRGGSQVGFMCIDNECIHYLETGIRFFEL